MSFSLRAILGLDAAGFESGLLLQEQAARASGKKISEGLRGEGGSILGAKAETLIGGYVGGFIAEKLAESFKEAVRHAHELRAVSQDIGASVGNVQVYEEAFDGTEHLTMAFRSLAEARTHAFEGGAGAQKYIDDFARLGVSMQDLKSKNMDQVFQQIGEQIKNAAIDGDEISAVADTLGRSGLQMVDGFKRGITDLHAEMAKKGEILSQQDLDSMEEAWRTIESLGRKYLVFISQGLLGWKEFFSVLSGKHADFVTKQISSLDALKQIEANKAANDKAKQDAKDAAHKSAVDQIAAIEAKSAELKYRELTPEQKKVELAKQRAAIEAQITANSYAALYGDDAAVKQAQLKEQLEEIKLAQSEIHENKPEKETAHRPDRIDVNAAQRAGAYSYAASAQNEAQRQTRLLNNIHEGIQTMIHKKTTWF